MVLISKASALNKKGELKKGVREVKTKNNRVMYFNDDKPPPRKKKEPKKEEESLTVEM